jgi:hypothetical protein
MPRLRLLILGLAALSIFAVSGSAVAAGSPSFAGGQRLVMALYYPWYDVSTWESGIAADYPLLPYESWERDAIERHVGWAKGAGIDALVSAWYGPRDNNPTENNLKTLLDAAQPTGLKVAIMLETDSGQFFPDRGSMVAALKHALATHAAHPAYLRIDGRPVIYVWRPGAVFTPSGGRVGTPGPAANAAWRAMLDEVDPERKAIWYGESEDASMLDVFDGMFPYSIAWAGDPAGQLASYARRVAGYNAANGTSKLWIGTAMPGYDDTRIPGRSSQFSVDRGDGAYYRKTFEGAIASGAQHILIASFNEWPEGHQIEPAVSYGTRYLELTAELARRFKGN